MEKARLVKMLCRVQGANEGKGESRMIRSFRCRFRRVGNVDPDANSDREVPDAFKETNKVQRLHLMNCDQKLLVYPFIYIFSNMTCARHC